MPGFKRPVSVLVVIYTAALDVLLLERAGHPGYWQSVTGSQEDGESLIETARREVAEETGIVAPQSQFEDWGTTNTFEIFTEWRHRYAPGVTHNWVPSGLNEVLTMRLATASAPPLWKPA